MSLIAIRSRRVCFVFILIKTLIQAASLDGSEGMCVCVPACASVTMFVCVCVENNTLPPPPPQAISLFAFVHWQFPRFLTCEVWKVKVPQHGSVFVLVCTLLNKCEAVALSVWTLEKTNAHLLLSADREGHRAVSLLSLLRPS